MYVEITKFTRWLRCKSPYTSTHRHYTSDLKLFFAWADKPPAAITVSDVDAYIAHCQTQGHAVTTIKRRLAALSAFYQFLQTHTDEPPPNPVIPRRHFIKQGRRLPRDVADSDLDRLFAVITSVRDRAIFILMLRCGLRVGEVHRLSLADLDLKPPAGQLPRLRVRGKGGKQRVVYLSPQALAALNEWLVARPDSLDQAMFLNRFGRRMSVAGIQDRLARYCGQAGLSITCHRLRHTFGRHLTEAQVPVTTTQQLLGHSRLKTTQLYTHLSNRQAQAEYEAAMAQITGWLGQSEQTFEVSETSKVSPVGAGGGAMTLSTGQRQFHFKHTRPTDATLKPFAEWLPANQKFLQSSGRGSRRAVTATVLSTSTASASGWR